MPNMIHVGTYSAVTAVSQGDPEGRHGRNRAGREGLHEMPVEDVFAKNGKVAAQRPHGPRHVSVPGEEARGEQERVGHVQAAGQDPGRRGLLSVADSGCQSRSKLKPRRERRGRPADHRRRGLASIRAYQRSSSSRE